MTRRIRISAVAAAAWLLVLGLAAPARAQVFTGGADVTIEDSSGARLTGAKVELAGPIVQAQVSAADGRSRFAELPVGIYAVAITMQGLPSSNNHHIEVLSGATSRLTVQM